MKRLVLAHEAIGCAARDARQRSVACQCGGVSWSHEVQLDVPSAPVDDFFLGRAQSLAKSSAYATDLGRSLSGLQSPRKFVEEASIVALECARLSSSCFLRAHEPGWITRSGVDSNSVLGELYLLAVKNEVDGRVHATFRAARSRYQAENCHHETYRSVFEEIADAETRHAILFSEIQGWLVSQLSPQRSRELARLQREAVAELRVQAACSQPDETLIRHCGVPDLDALRALLSSLEQSFWGSERSQSEL